MTDDTIAEPRTRARHGRHAATRRRPRRPRRGRLVPKVALVAAVALILVLGLWAVLRDGSGTDEAGPSCERSTPLRVVADPAVSSAVDTAVRSLESSCVTVDLSSVPSGEIAAALARQ
ncbi:MAG: hypothetical protein ACRCZD_04070, partial [Phycicoccus sp.]